MFVRLSEDVLELVEDIEVLPEDGEILMDEVPGVVHLNYRSLEVQPDSWYCKQNYGSLMVNEGDFVVRQVHISPPRE